MGTSELTIGRTPADLSLSEMKLLGRADSGVYGALQEEMWRETISYLDRSGAAETVEANSRAQAAGVRSTQAEALVTEWESRNGRTKL